MAVYDNYVDTQILAGRLTSPERVNGSNTISMICVFDTTAAHDANSIYRIFKAVPSSAVPKSIKVWTDGVTGMSDVDLGVYKVGAGKAAVSAECLAATLDLSSSVAEASALNGLNAVTNSNRNKSLWEIAGQTETTRESAYDIGLKSVNDLSEADTVVVVAEFFLP